MRQNIINFETLSITLVALAVFCSLCCAQPVTYRFEAEIDEVSVNENGVIPGLEIGTLFFGTTTFESTGWDRSEGTIDVTVNGLNLLYEMQLIHGSANFRFGSHNVGIIGDSGASPVVGGNSTFVGTAFGISLRDSDRSGGHLVALPAIFNLDEFDRASFFFSGSYVPTGDQIIATGRLSSLASIPEPSTLTPASLVILACAMRRFRRRKSSG